MLIDLLIIAAALAVLAIAADRFVTAASSIASSLGASVMFVGVVLAGIGTSLPDWLVSALAAADGQDGLAVGNFVGSNTINIGLALGLAAIITPILVSESVLRREAAISIIAVLAVGVLLFAGLGTLAGVVLVLALPVALWALRPTDPPPRDPDLITGSLPRESLIVLLTLVGLVGGSRLLVDSATDIALELGISEAFIGLSLVAIGTSLPEIVVGVRSAMRGETDLLIGNVFGSNLFNSLGLAGSVALITPDPPLDTSGLEAAIVLMAVFAVAAGALLATGRRLLRWEGAALVAIYCLTLPLFA